MNRISVPIVFLTVWMISACSFSVTVPSLPAKTEDKTEWTDTKISFEISESGDKTEVRFTHIGLVPLYKCYDVCSNGWSTHINGSLRNLITTGKGQPNVGDAITDNERALSE